MAAADKKNMTETLYLVIPAYNESENIKRTVEEWYPVIEKHNAGGTSRMVVINDGSTDDTGAILAELEGALPLLCVRTKQNGGHGPAVIHGYMYALEKGADYIFQTDSDGQTDPAEFEKFWKMRLQYEGIFGSRKVRGDGRTRAFVEKVLCAVLRLIFRVRVPDANAPFRLMRASYVREGLAVLPRDYNLPNVILTVYGAYHRRRIRFVPITFGPRRGGKNSVNIRNIVRMGVHALKDFADIRKKWDRCRNGSGSFDA